LESFQIDVYSIIFVEIVPFKKMGDYNKPEKRKIGLMIDNTTQLIKEGKFDKALLICEDALKIDPTDVVIITQKGVAYCRLQKLDEAIKCFDLALRINPKFADAVYNKATVTILQNDVPSTLFLLEQSIKLDPRLRMIARTDEDFLYLRSNPDFMMLVGS
jgi:tetratricopeptide (TPR) repeat protein